MPCTVAPLRPDSVAELSRAFAPPPYRKRAAQFRRYLEEHQTGLRTMLVAWAEGRMAGYVTVLWRSAYPPFAAAGVPEVSDLNVRQSLRRRGIGTALVTAAERAVRAAGHPVVGIGVGLTPDYDAARRLYPALGYRPEGGGPWLDASGPVEYLVKPLQNGAPAG